MTTSDLRKALLACAAGFYPHEAGVGLLITHASFLDRSDFTGRFIRHGLSITDGSTNMAQIDWTAAITALGAGELPCSGGEGIGPPLRRWRQTCADMRSPEYAVGAPQHGLPAVSRAFRQPVTGHADAHAFGHGRSPHAPAADSQLRKRTPAGAGPQDDGSDRALHLISLPVGKSPPHLRRGI